MQEGIEIDGRLGSEENDEGQGEERAHAVRTWSSGRLVQDDRVAGGSRLLGEEHREPLRYRPQRALADPTAVEFRNSGELAHRTGAEHLAGAVGLGRGDVADLERDTVRRAQVEDGLPGDPLRAGVGRARHHGAAGHEEDVRPVALGEEAVQAPVGGNWMGQSRGHWEGDSTLVIETTGFRPGPSATNIVTSGSPPENDTPISDQASLTERLTMTGPDTIVYESTWTDPVIFTEPWGTRLEWQRADDYEMFEYACHEGNVQIRNYITADRALHEGSETGAAD